MRFRRTWTYKRKKKNNKNTNNNIKRKTVDIMKLYSRNEDIRTATRINKYKRTLNIMMRGDEKKTVEDDLIKRFVVYDECIL